jgi:hypothetical protein
VSIIEAVAPPKELVSPAPRLGYVGTTEETLKEVEASGLPIAVVQLPEDQADRRLYYSGAVALSVAIERAHGPRPGQDGLGAEAAATAGGAAVVAGEDWLPPILANRAGPNGNGRYEPKPITLDEEVFAYLTAESKAIRSR